VRILLLNQYFPPDNSATAKMAQTVVDALSAKHEVVVVCGRPSYDPGERHPWRPWQMEKNERVEIVRVGSTDYSRVRMKRRVLNYLSYTALAVPRSLLERCDVVIGMTDPPYAGILGAFVAGLKRKPFVYNIRDLYPDMATGGSIIETGFLSRIWEILHRWALRRAAKVVVLGEDMRARIIRKGVHPDHTVLIRDGADLNASCVTLDDEVIRSIRGDFRLVLVHAGNLGFYGAWETLIAGARQLAKDGVGLVFVGEGAQLADLQRFAAGATNIRFLPFFPSSKIPSVLASADLHVITVKPLLTGVVVPSKIYGILAAGKPILVLAKEETEAAQIAVAQNCGCVVSPEDPSELVNAVRAILSNPQSLQRMSAAARAAAPAYDRVDELKKFVATIEEVVAA
jgi:colanic acid biosynthesis glycosyl transferase WcaI